MTNRQKLIIIISGTIDIHRPLYKFLQSRIAQPVILLGIENEQYFVLKLKELCKDSDVYIFPSNEVTLNIFYELMKKNEYLIESKKIKIPGEGILNNIVYSSSDISNKATMYNILRNHTFKNFRVAQTEIITINNNIRLNFENREFPFVVKPVQKDINDSFTKIFPSKILIIKDYEHFVNIIKKYPEIFYNRKFLIQELLKGSVISWCGYVKKDIFCGYKVKHLVKSPIGNIGGTTTFCSIEEVDKQFELAVEELLNFIQLDGIFEIEFILKNEILYFFHEINPRPWLQISLLLYQEPNILLEYLEKNGFSVNKKKKEKRKIFWGSAIRYLDLNKNKNISLRLLLKTLLHDIRLSQFFVLKERLNYIITIVKKYLKNEL